MASQENADGLEREPSIEELLNRSSNLESRSRNRKSILVIISLCVIAFAVGDIASKYRPDRRDNIDLPMGEEELITQVFKDYGLSERSRSQQRLKNPEISWWENMFCLGYKKASICSEKPLHPRIVFWEEMHGEDFETYRREHGRPLEKTRIPGKTEDNLPLKFQIQRN